MDATKPLLVGRDTELAVLDQVLTSLGDGPAGLLVDGELGIGKTTVWKAGLADAHDRGYRVLQCRPIESEAPLAYAALGDLLRDVPESAFTTIPSPQRRALDVALLRAEPDDRQPFPQAAALGLLALLGALAHDAPVIVAIDDVQWLDAESERALVFAARRIVDERVGFLLTRRNDSAAASALDTALRDALPDGRHHHLLVQALAAADLDLLLQTRLGTPVARRIVTAIHHTSGGNAFIALEIARAMHERGDLHEADADVPLPPSVQALVGERLALLPADDLEVVRFAAAMSRPTARSLAAVIGGTGVAEALRRAADAGIVEVDGDRVSFTHPLLASVAYFRLSAPERRTLHARLAAATDDSEERVRHLALAYDEPNAEVAAELDDAARRAQRRGAPDAAASLLEHARRLTPPSAADDALRRGIEAAERLFEAGDAARSNELLATLIGEAPPGRLRARALARLGWVQSQIDGFHAGARAFRDALAEPADDPALHVEIEQGLAWCVHTTIGLSGALPHAHTSLRLAERIGDPTLLAGALAYVAFLDSLTGEGIATSTIDRAMALGHSPSWSQILGRPDWIQAVMLVWDDQLPAAHERFLDLRRQALEDGNEHALPAIYFQLARTHLLLGEWEQAAQLSAACLTTTIQSGQVAERPYALTIAALVQTHLGHVDLARAVIDEGVRIAGDLGVQPAAFEMRAARGFLELSLGENDAAVVTFDALAADVARFGFREPALFRFHGDAIESLTATGEIERARTLLAELDQLGATLRRTSVSMVANRGHGILLATTGDFDGAYAAFERSLACTASRQPFEHARTTLALGTVQRRDRKKRAARDSIVAALGVFDRLGARVWAERARAELERVGGGVPDEFGLTATEQRVAELIAGGRTYREAADELFISPKTVQWNLSKIYRKLGIRSRAQLAAHLNEPGRDA